VSTWHSQADEGIGRGLERYRSYGKFYERYWSRLFGMTQADMERFAALMRARGAPVDLTTLAREVIRSRLRQGPEINSGPAPNGSMPAQIVRVWDPGAIWRVGDRAIMAVPAFQEGRSLQPAVGEMRQVGDDHVIIQIDGIAAPQVYALGMQGGVHQRSGYSGSDHVQASLNDEIQSLATRPDTASRIDLILWRFGGIVVGRLLHALQADPNFVELEGVWYCVELTRPLREGQLKSLARALFDGPDRPLSVDDLLALLTPAGAIGVTERFGAMLSLNSRPDLFANVGSLSYPRWILAGPPPMHLVARHAVFDPETYTILCTAGEHLSPEAARRLWDAGLLRTALGTGGETPVTVGQQAEDYSGQLPSFSPPEELEAAAQTRDAAPHRRSWRRWLPFASRD
jgi:hypothetical protein